MGQCGCGDFNATHRLPGPAGFVYAFQVHAGCNNGCNVPAGVVVYRFSEEEAKHWGVHELPEMRLDGDCDSSLVRVLDATKLKAHLVEFAKKHGAEYDPDGLVQDAVDHSLIRAIDDTCEEAKKR